MSLSQTRRKTHHSALWQDLENTGAARVSRSWSVDSSVESTAGLLAIAAWIPQLQTLSGDLVVSCHSNEMCAPLTGELGSPHLERCKSSTMFRFSGVEKFVREQRCLFSHCSLTVPSLPLQCCMRRRSNRSGGRNLGAHCRVGRRVQGCVRCLPCTCQLQLQFVTADKLQCRARC